MPAPLPFRSRVAVGAGRMAALASRTLGRGAGEVVSGKVALRLAPSVLADLGRRHPSALISATNGKTTTTRLLAAAVSSTRPVVSNVGGANMAPGVISALSGAPQDAFGVLEVDELHLPGVAGSLRPELVLLLNLSRDQLDRSNETRRIAGRWRELGNTLASTTCVANADDPLIVWAAGGFATTFWVYAGQSWTSDAMVCPQCAGLLRRAAADAGGSADWDCPRCGLRRPVATIGVAGPHEVVVDGARLRVDLQLPGRCNVANAAMALAGGRLLGVDVEGAVAAMASVTSVAGRYQTVQIAGRPARLLLAKNPAGWLEMLELLAEEPERPVLIDFNARTADGRDPSWLWDVPVAELGKRPVLVSGDRAADALARLEYAGVAAVAYPSAAEAIGHAPGSGRVDVLATYTAFRHLLVAYGGLR